MKFKKNSFFESIYKIEKTVIKFGDIEIQKQKFHQHKGPISIKNVDIHNIVVSNKVPFGQKDLHILLVAKMLKKKIFMHNSPKHDFIQ